MAKLIPFSAEHFTHLTPEERYETQRLVFQLKFQQGVRELRRKYHLNNPKEPPSVVDQIAANKLLSGAKPNKQLEDDLAKLLAECDYEDEYYWLGFAFLLTVFNVVKRNILQSCTPKEDLRSITEDIEKEYTKVDALFAAGKEQEARQLLKRADGIIYETHKVIVSTAYRNFNIWLSSDVDKDDLESMRKAIMKFKQPFARQQQIGRNNIKSKKKPEDSLQLHCDIAEWYRNGESIPRITELMKEKRYYKRSADSIRQMIHIATKVLGF